MKKETSGFIFIATLLMTTVISLLVLACMHHILLFHQAVNRQEERHQSFYQMENIAMQLARASLHNLDPKCLRKMDEVNRVIQMLKSNNGCSLTVNKYHYRYLIEELKDNPCLIVNIKQNYFSTHHRRVTLFLVNTESSGALLQIRYITPIAIFPCFGELREVKEGVSSWRFFYVG